MNYQLIVMGVSSGGSVALTEILSALPRNFSLPLVIVQHLHHRQDLNFLKYFRKICAMPVTVANEKEAIVAGHIYFAPPNYHLLIEQTGTFSLSIDEPVHFSRPSIDVLFESAVDAYGSRLIGVILSGANGDGAWGLELVKQNHGLTMVQDPESAVVDYMPRAAIAAVKNVDHILPLPKIGPFLARLDDGASINFSRDENI